MRLGTEGYSPAVLRKATRQACTSPSFREASADLDALLQIHISPSHLSKLAQRIGAEWVLARDADVAAFKGDKLPCAYAEAAPAAAVMIDGGTLNTRADDRPRGVHEKCWREYKSACCLSLSSQLSTEDPQPEPSSKFLDPVKAARLAAEMKARRGSGKSPFERKADGSAGEGVEKVGAVPKQKRRGKKQKKGPRKLVRTVLASMATSEEFGWQVAAEVQRRGLDRAKRKACVCDGQKYNWSIFEMHLCVLGFIGVLDFVHLLSYLYGAAQALCGKGTAEAWQVYEQWLRWAWSGKVSELIAGLQTGSERLGDPPAGCAEGDARKVLAEALGYVRNNRSRMDYPRYRRLGLPISSAPVESTIKQLNRRVKGTEKFWLEDGAETLLQLRAAHLSEDDSAQRFWDKPRPHPRAVGAARLRPSP